MAEPPPVVLFADQALRDFMENVAYFVFTPPFSPDWARREKAVLPGCHLPGDRTPVEAFGRIANDVQRHVAEAAGKLRGGRMAAREEMAVYRGAAIFALFSRYQAEIQKIIDADGTHAPFFDDYVTAYERLGFHEPHHGAPEPGHLLGLMYQWQRNVFTISTTIRGRSQAAAEARAAIYEASMAGDICTYARTLSRSMDRIPVLITGETGTGKELAARCIAWSRYIPFDATERRFVKKHRAGLYAHNLSALSRDLIESELFGHRKGSFTGATSDKIGILASPEAGETLFLDEIGEISEPVQVKLLRPLEAREIVVIGETQSRPIQGRHVFATNKDLEQLCREGKFRPDLLERLNGVHVKMPPLRLMLAEDPAELGRYVRWFVAEKIDDAEQVEALTRRILRRIAREHRDPAWTRNLRQLKHVTERYLMSVGSKPDPEVTGLSPPADLEEAEPPPASERRARAPESACVPSSGLFGHNAKRGEVSVEEIMRAYVTEVYVLTGLNISETARRTGLSRRTVRRLIDPARLARLLARRA